MIVPVTCETAASSRLEDPFEMLTHIATGDLKDEAGRRQSAVSASVAVSKIGSVRVAECRGLEAEPLSVRIQRFFDQRPVCKTVAFGRRHLRTRVVRSSRPTRASQFDGVPAALQFKMTTIGEAGPDAMEFIRKRWPSAETAYWCSGGTCTAPPM